MRLQDNKQVNGVSYVGAPRSSTAVYITKKVENLLENLAQVQDCLVFLQPNMEIPASLKDRHQFVVVENPSLAYAHVAWEIEKEIEKQEEKLKFICTPNGCYISETAVVGHNVKIEPGCVIGHHVSIGDNAWIQAGTIIKNATIGNNFVCGEHATIGSFAFTMIEDENGNKFRIPSLGKVIIGNSVEAGANTNIARGSCGDTRLGDYVKLDALVHIGHDAQLDQNVEVTAGAIIAGFAQLDRGVYVGLNAAIRNRIRLNENCFIGMGATVTKDIDANAIVSGNPARRINMVKNPNGGG